MGNGVKRAAWILPSLLEGSGGHRTILQNACYLASKGEFECDLYIEDDGSIKNNAELREKAEKFFGPCDGCRFFLGYSLQSDTYDLLFATAWYTAKVVRDIPLNVPKIYFVQDFEACFNPMGDGYLLACNSYCYGLKPITIEKWLTHKMRTEFGVRGQYFDFCADKEIYHPLDGTEKENALCFIYQPDKPRRCCTLGIEALGIVKYLRPEVRIYLYGSTQRGHVWFEHTNLGIIPIRECNELYNRCRVGLCISSSNPSRIPFEMMAAGLPVVDVYMENNLYDMPDEAISLAHYTPESIAKALIDILDSPERQSRMSAAGRAFMQDKGLAAGYEQFYQGVLNVMNGTIPEVGVSGRLYNTGPVVADVIEGVSSTEVPEEHASQQPGLIGRLKSNPWLRRNRFVRKVWSKAKNASRRIFQ